MTAEEQLQYLASRQAAADAQQYLSQALRADAGVSLKLARLDQMRAQGKKPRLAPAPPPEPDLKTREAEVLADYSALLRLRQDIAAHIRRVPHQTQRSVLELRYLEGSPFFRIAMTLHYDERTIYRLHRAGLRHVAAQLMQEGLLPAPADPGE